VIPLRAGTFLGISAVSAYCAKLSPGVLRSTSVSLEVGGFRGEIGWRSGIFEFCLWRSAFVTVEVVAPARFTFCIVRRNFPLGVQNPIVSRGSRWRLFGNSRLDAVRSRAILNGFTFIDVSLARV
jgi:hypothetical protein